MRRVPKIPLHLFCLVNCLLQIKKNSFSVSAHRAEPTRRHEHVLLTGLPTIVLLPHYTLWTHTHQAKLVLTVIFLEESSNNKVMGGYTELYK